MGEAKIAANNERASPEGYYGEARSTTGAVVGEARLADNAGAAGFGGALQGLGAGQFVAVGESVIAVADSHLCVLDCTKGKAESERFARQ